MLTPILMLTPTLVRSSPPPDLRVFFFFFFFVEDNPYGDGLVKLSAESPNASLPLALTSPCLADPSPNLKPPTRMPPWPWP